MEAKLPHDELGFCTHVEVSGHRILFKPDLLVQECGAVVADEAVLAADALAERKHTPEDRQGQAYDEPADAQSFLNRSAVVQFHCLVDVVVEEGFLTKNRH